jgi:hypothetical protein
MYIGMPSTVLMGIETDGMCWGVEEQTVVGVVGSRRQRVRMQELGQPELAPHAGVIRSFRLGRVLACRTVGEA